MATPEEVPSPTTAAAAAAAVDETPPQTQYLPLPPPKCILTSDPHAQLSDHQQPIYDAVLAHFSNEAYRVPSGEKDWEGEGGPAGVLIEDEKFWLSRECLLRYCRATKWKSAAVAIQRIEGTLKWRRDFGLYDLVTAKHVEPEALTGKEVVFGYEVSGRPALYMMPSRQNTDESIRQIQFTVWILERCFDLMPAGVETLTLLINYADKAKTGRKGPSFSTGRLVLNILQDHYPERLGHAIVINVPFLMNAFFKLITPFIDPNTREKLRFNAEPVSEGLFTGDNIFQDFWGGDVEFEYEHDKYWPAFVEMTEKQVAEWKERWRTLGGKVGVKEWDYKRGEVEVEKEVSNGEVSNGEVNNGEVIVDGKESS